MTHTHQTQTFQLNQLTKEVAVTSGADGDYVLLEHVRDAFHFADEFTLDGEPVPFLEDEHLERYSIHCYITTLPALSHLTRLDSFCP